jgi:hypothetical protein
VPVTRGYAASAPATAQSVSTADMTSDGQNRPAATRRFDVRYAYASGCRVDLVDAYSNHADHVERVRALLDLPKAPKPRRPERPAKQAQKRLDRDDVAAYTAGGRVEKLATLAGSTGTRCTTC